MDKLNFNIVTGCGDEDRVAYRYRDICYVGCFNGTRSEVIEAIKKKYDNIAKKAYISKINELYDTNITSHIDRGVDIAADDNYATKSASKNGHLDVVKYLVEHGADVTVDDDYAVRWASKNGHLDVVKYLVEQGVDVTTNGNCAIRCASDNGRLGMIKYLVEHGADVTTDDNYIVRRASENG
ncbi:MAG: hypothetical protein DRP47_09960, partial [Candidatus Zixiibacteriota bacterium]